MDLIKVVVMEMKEEKKKMQGVQIIKRQSSIDAASSSAQKVGMVGFDDVLYEMLDKITGGERVRQIIPIVGMGGLGKTTLARNMFENPLVKEHFHICAWSTISQVHNARKILTEILGQVDRGNKGDLSDYELGEKLYQHLIGRRYLIVMDDMWSIEAWDRVRSFFPENENGSRVVVTTRLSNLASMFNYFDGVDLKFLDEASSWNLFSKTVFGDETFPPELEDVGKNILKGCRGLPLSIVVVGGLLSKCEATQENWEVIEKNLSSVVNLEGDGSCLQALYTSYNNLPVCIKPCFLFMGVFPEDEEISYSMLIPLWVAEGFVKPIDGKSLEEAAEEYLEELVGRHMILVEERSHYGKLKSCKMHDLLRDLALREAEKHKFLSVLLKCGSEEERIISTQCRRIATSFDQEHNFNELLEATGASSSLVRSLIGRFPAKTLSLASCRLLRVFMADPEEESREGCYEHIFIWLPNLRFLLVNAEDHPLTRVLSSPFCFPWNLQALILGDDEGLALEIWKMPLLRHVIIRDGGTLRLPDPPPFVDNDVVLENLNTLSVVRNLKLSEELLKRIPNIRILYLCYGDEVEEEKKGDHYCLNNLGRLNKLRYLRLIRYGPDSPPMQELTFPYSLKKLTLKGTKLPWEEMASKIGWLPLLQVLKLKEDSFIGSEWETVEGQFSCLKFLVIHRCDLEYWMTDNTHFPRLEHLLLRDLTSLREVPSSIGDVPTLRSIELLGCSDSAVESARRMLEEQEELGNQDIHLQVY